MLCKEINIRNPEELEKFYKKIWFYRSRLCHMVHFNIQEDKYNVQPIIEALNIKHKKARIIYIYNQACQQIDDFYADKDICEFKDNQCLAQRQTDRVNGCCRLCEYRTGGNCPSRNLACKLFYCFSAMQKHQLLTFDDIPILKCLNRRQRFMIKSDYFSLEKDVIMDLYYGILIGTCRVMWRFGRSLIKNKKRSY